VGAGPAGLTAAIYARRASKSTLVLEANAYGGQIINTLDIENYPVEAHISGFDFATKLYNQATELGAEIEFEKVTEIKDNGASKEVITEDGSYEAKAVIIATGSANRKLGLENEDELIGRGVSYCATCDGAFYKDKNIAVVGGGNTALEDALYLADVAKKVYLIHRRDEFRGAEASIAKLKEKQNVEFVLNSQVTKLIAEKRLQAVEVTNEDGSVKKLGVDGIFVAVGRMPETQGFAKLIKLDKAGYIVGGENCHTNVEGIFVAGDTRTKELRQLVTATSDGAIAATEAINYINK
jgi:thioredoxin reductase (NADPH)